MITDPAAIEIELRRRIERQACMMEVALRAIKRGHHEVAELVLQGAFPGLTGDDPLAGAGTRRPGEETA